MDETASSGGGVSFDLNRVADSLFGFLGKKAEADARVASQRGWLDNNPNYGVDENGRIYQRGQVSGLGLAPGSPLVGIGVAVLAITIVVWALKS